MSRDDATTRRRQTTLPPHQFLTVDMVLNATQQHALEAAILAYLTAQGERFARTAAAFKDEAQFQRGETVQTPSGGAVPFLMTLAITKDSVQLIATGEQPTR